LLLLYLLSIIWLDIDILCIWLLESTYSPQYNYECYSQAINWIITTY